MESKNLIGVVMTITVAVILIGSLLVVTLSTYSDEETTHINEGANYALYELGDTHTITFTSTSMVTDGVEQDLPDTSVYGAATVAYGDGGMYRYHSDGTLKWWGYVSDSGAQRNLGPATSITITIAEDGTGTTTGASTNRSIGTAIMLPDPNGGFALTYNPGVLTDSAIYGCGATTVDDVSYGLSWSGTIEDGITATAIYPPQSFGDITVNTSNPATNLLKIESVVIDNTTADADFTYTYFFAPKEIVYDNPAYLGSANAALLGAIVLLAIVGVLMVAVRAFNRD